MMLLPVRHMVIDVPDSLPGSPTWSSQFGTLLCVHFWYEGLIWVIVLDRLLLRAPEVVVLLAPLSSVGDGYVCSAAVFGWIESRSLNSWICGRNKCAANRHASWRSIPAQALSSSCMSSTQQYRSQSIRVMEYTCSSLWLCVA